MQARTRQVPDLTLDDSRTRFQIELEFVQCLANPSYLNCKWSLFPVYLLEQIVLAQQGCFEKPAFISYLKYLQYWKEPVYSRYLIYPYCLRMLELLQHSEFRSALARGQICRLIDDQILLHWQHYMRKRATLIAKHVEDITTRNLPNENNAITMGE